MNDSFQLPHSFGQSGVFETGSFQDVCDILSANIWALRVLKILRIVDLTVQRDILSVICVIAVSLHYLTKHVTGCRNLYSS